MIKILKISIDQDEENKIFETLISKFDLRCSDIFSTGQKINFPLTEEIEVYSKLELDCETTDPDENNQSIIICQNAMMSRFILDFFIDGEQIEVVRESAIGKCIEDRIEKNYRI